MRRVVVITRCLLGLYAVLAMVSVDLAVGSALRGEYGSAALNAVLAVVWSLPFRRLIAGDQQRDGARAEEVEEASRQLALGAKNGSSLRKPAY